MIATHITHLLVTLSLLTNHRASTLSVVMYALALVFVALIAGHGE